MRKTSLNFSRSEMLRKVALVALMLAIQAITGIGAGVLFAQNVTGQVVSASDQEPLIGASVKVEGTSIGSLTDIDGNFTVSARGGQTLVVSSIREPPSTWRSTRRLPSKKSRRASLTSPTRMPPTTIKPAV